MNAGYHASFRQCRLYICPLAMRLFKEKGYNPAVTGFGANRAASVRYTTFN
jgi:hypothetical protein